MLEVGGAIINLFFLFFFSFYCAHLDRAKSRGSRGGGLIHSAKKCLLQWLIRVATWRQERGGLKSHCSLFSTGLAIKSTFLMRPAFAGGEKKMKVIALASLKVLLFEG